MCVKRDSLHDGLLQTTFFASNKKQDVLNSTSCITKYLKDIQITVNKPVLNSEYNHDNNLVVYHQNIRGLSNKIYELSVFINNTHTHTQ
jgi:hypothetical protein